MEKDDIDKIQKEIDEKNFSQKKKNWGYTGQFFTIPVKGGELKVLKMPSGTLYLMKSDGSRKKVTEQWINELVAKLNSKEVATNES